jgi:D-glycero-alpha-D-manno-heptose-7-phosphate kinase
MKITAKAPCRVDLAGGTLDIWPLYLYHANAVTVNFAINRWTSCVLETRKDRRIALSSADLKTSEGFASLDALASAPRYRLPLPAHLIRFFAPRSGITLLSNSEAPAGAGIAGSSALMITIAGALNRLTGARHPIEKLRQIAQNIEARIIRVPTGCQDYYPAMYGGVSAIELRADGIERKPIAVDLDDFNERIVLAYTGVPRNSGINNWEVIKAHIDGSRKVQRNLDEIAAIAHAMRGAVEKADWAEAGRLVREEWAHRRRNAPGISTPLIDHLVKVALRAGSTGAKVCGAGGGGCVLFLAERGARSRVSDAITEAGGTVLPVRVAQRGLRVSTAWPPRPVESAC